MNFATMLMTPTTSLDAVWKGGKGRSSSPTRRDTSEAVSAHRGQAIARYIKVMGEGWVRTALIEQRLGYVRGTAFKTLVRMEKEGIIERRAAVPTPGYTKAGWEWRTK